ncbi:MAG: hypothetical protein J07HQX50_01062 [Haloquadratum sp. J07HQX50]|nr:MAG: hypothetical protein J07HQX50_01062 [Haloquadratum sp. J07HQX50]
MTGVVMDAPTFVAPLALARVLRIHCVHKHASFLALCSTHCLSLRNAHFECQSAYGRRSQIPSLEDECDGIIFESSRYDSVGDRAQDVLYAFVFSPVHFLQSTVC